LNFVVFGAEANLATPIVASRVALALDQVAGARLVQLKTKKDF
jgi:hypothetical protein